MTNLASSSIAAALHSTFRIERRFEQIPSRVFIAFSDKEQVRRWRIEGEGCEVLEFQFDFRVGGNEVSRFTFGGGPEIRLDAEFHDIIPDRRIVFSYRMAVKGAPPFSASLTTVEFSLLGTGTLLAYTEQNALLDGTDSATSREEGCRGLLEKLATELQR